MNAVVDYINLHLGEEIDLKSLAAISHFSLRLFLYNQKQRAALSAGMADIASGAPKPAANREVAGSTALQKAIR